MRYCTDQTDIAAVIGEFHAMHQNIQLENKTMSVPSQLAALLDGQLDVGFVRPPIRKVERRAGGTRVGIRLTSQENSWTFRQACEMNAYEPWPVEAACGSAASLRARGRWARRSIARCRSSVAI